MIRQGGKLAGKAVWKTGRSPHLTSCRGFQVGLKESHPGPVRDVNQQRQVDDGGGVELVKGSALKFAFIGRGEAPKIESKRRRSLRKIKSGVFPGQGELPKRRLPRQYIAEGDACIISAEDQVHTPVRRLTFFETNRELVVMVPHGEIVIDPVLPGGVMRRHTAALD